MLCQYFFHRTETTGTLKLRMNTLIQQCANADATRAQQGGRDQGPVRSQSPDRMLRGNRKGFVASDGLLLKKGIKGGGRNVLSESMREALSVDAVRRERER